MMHDMIVFLNPSWSTMIYLDRLSFPDESQNDSESDDLADLLRMLSCLPAVPFRIIGNFLNISKNYCM